MKYWAVMEFLTPETTDRFGVASFVESREEVTLDSHCLDRAAEGLGARGRNSHPIAILFEAALGNEA